MNDFWTAASAILAIALAMGGAYKIGVMIGSARMRKALADDRDRQSLTEIYAPLFGLFTTRHITTVSGRAAPYLRQRFRNAVKVFTDEGRPIKALKAVFDKEDLGVSGEVEYGGSFPLGTITKHLKGREHLADRELLLLVAGANRARYEQATEHNELTDEDLRLFQHISDRHEQLTKRLG